MDIAGQAGGMRHYSARVRVLAQVFGASPMMRAEYIDHMGSDLLAANAARVSFAKWRETLGERDEGLIAHLAAHDHWTPSAHPQVCMRITAPIFVARQWWRSVVGVARNEVSRRYVDDVPKYYTPKAWRERPEASIKQGSGGPVDPTLNTAICHEYENLCELAVELYQSMIKMGIAPEQARMVLPQSTYTQWIETGSLAYFARVCRQRLAADAQLEVRELAAAVQDVVQPLFPVSWGVLVEEGA